MKQIQILLAEDNRGDVVLVQQALAEHGIEHDLHVVADGAEALNYITRMGKPQQPPCPDLMILDLGLPKAEGPQVLREFRSHPDCGAKPVIVMSSSTSAPGRIPVNELGANRYFRKPSDLDEFMQLGTVVKSLMANSGTHFA